MENLVHRRSMVDTKQFFILNPISPFVDIILQSIAIHRHEFSKIMARIGHYHNGPRMIEMVRKAGDASAKVPYLMDARETTETILATLREIVQPHLEHIQSLPAPVQATIHLLLSINMVPHGCEMCALPALLEIDRIQGDIVRTLRHYMSGRQLARDFHNNLITALQMLDRDWPHLRQGRGLRWPNSLLPLPAQAQTQYEPFFDTIGRLISLREACVIVDAPDTYLLQSFIPPVLRRPLPTNIQVPIIGSADWLIREVGKVGRHFTRALLEIIKEHLAAEQVALDSRNYALINQQAQDALHEYMHKTP